MKGKFVFILGIDQKNRENYADVKKMLGISRELWGERGNSEWIFTAVYGMCFTRFG